MTAGPAPRTDEPLPPGADRVAPGALAVIRMHDRPGALERVLGLLRRRAFIARPFSLVHRADRELELGLELDARDRRDRLRIELLALEDVREVAVYVTENHESGEA